MSSIAYSHGFYWQTLWNLPENSALKDQRKNPNVLMTGDIVHIPDLTPKQESRSTDARYQFVRKGVPEKLHIRLLDYDQKPRPNLDYVIVIDGDARRGKTDGDGRLVESIPPDAETAKITYAAPVRLDDKGQPIGKPENLVMTLNLGNLNPISEVSGQKARLANLGFYKGRIDENLDAATKQAITDFQQKNGLPATGVADDATKAELLKQHGH